MLMAVAQRRAAIYRDWLSPPGPPWRVRETGCLLCVSVCAWVRGIGTGVDGGLASGIQSGPTTQFARL